MPHSGARSHPPPRRSRPPAGREWRGTPRVSWRYSSKGPVERGVELRVLDEGLAQLARGFDPVRVRGEEDAAGADAVGTGVLDSWRSDAVLHVRPDRGDQPPADADHHCAGGAQGLYRPV